MCLGNDAGGLGGLYVSGVENQYEGEVVNVCAEGGLQLDCIAALLLIFGHVSGRAWAWD